MRFAFLVKILLVFARLLIISIYKCTAIKLNAEVIKAKVLCSRTF
jgi:hypothetical protein